MKFPKLIKHPSIVIGISTFAFGLLIGHLVNSTIGTSRGDVSASLEQQVPYWESFLFPNAANAYYLTEVDVAPEIGKVFASNFWERGAKLEASFSEDLFRYTNVEGCPSPVFLGTFGDVLITDSYRKTGVCAENRSLCSNHNLA